MAAVSFVLRFRLADAFLRTPYHEFTLNILGPDQNRFLTWAESIRAGVWTAPGSAADAPFQFSPVYPWLLSLSIGWREHPFALIFGLQALASSLAGLALWDTGRRLGCRAAGLAAAAIWLFYVPSIYFDGCLIRESLLASTGCLAFWAALAAWDRPSIARGIRAGLLLGFCAALRPHIFSAALFVLFAAAAAVRKDRARLAASAGIALAACLVIAPIALHNLSVSGRWVPVSTQGADALILGNDPDGPGIGFVPTDTSRAMLEKSGGTVPGAVRAIAAEFTAKPAAAAQLYARKLRMLVNDYEVPDNYSFYVWKLLLKEARRLPPLTWIVLFPLACLGFFTALRGKNRWRLAASATAVLLAGAAVIHIQSRYRFVAVPFLALLAGFGLVGILKNIQRGKIIALAASLALVLGIGCAVRPLPSLGYHEVTGSDGVRRLNRDVLREADYITLLVSWSLSGAQAQADVMKVVSNRAYRSYGMYVITEFDRTVRDLNTNLKALLTKSYREKYRITRI